MAVLIVLVSCGRSTKEESVQEGQLVAYPGRTFSYSQKFNDGQKKQMAAALKCGISQPLANRKEAEQMRGRLQRVKTTGNYIVDPLEHSVPYLVPKAADELNRIGEGFADILQRNGLPHYQFHISSILRTQEDIQLLQKSGNYNAVTTSCHCYGTTFDIAYTHFTKTSDTADYMTEDNLKLVLGQVLLNEQRAGHIYVKYEYKQACFHITVRP